MGCSLSPLHTEVVGDTATVLWVLLAAVGLVLLVACANVALLSLLAGLDRSDDTTIRLALGATPARLLREFLMESVLLAALGGVLGVAIAAAGVRLLPQWTTDLPRLDELALDARALGFTAAMTTLAALLAGLPQAWRRAHGAVAGALSAVSRRTTESGSRHLLRDVIVVGQVGLAVVLMAGFGAARPQLPPAAGCRSWIRSPRRPRRAHLPRQPGVHYRRAHAGLLPDGLRAPGFASGRNRRRRSDDGTDEPART